MASVGRVDWGICDECFVEERGGSVGCGGMIIEGLVRFGVVR